MVATDLENYLSALVTEWYRSQESAESPRNAIVKGTLKYPVHFSMHVRIASGSFSDLDLPNGSPANLFSSCESLEQLNPVAKTDLQGNLPAFSNLTPLLSDQPS